MRLMLINAQQAHAALSGLFKELKPHLMAGRQFVIEAKEPTRSTEQNSRLWAMLTDVSRQVDWYGRKLSPEAWKHLFSASLEKQDVVPGIDGGFVVLGISTSKMSVKRMGELMDLIEAFGAERGVKFTAMEEA